MLSCTVFIQLATIKGKLEVQSGLSFSFSALIGIQYLAFHHGRVRRSWA